MEVKSIIDLHYTSNYKYYKHICNRFYKGRYIADDMLHELYLGFLTVSPRVIIKFNEIDKLKCIGIKILKSLFSKRNLGTKNKGKQSSPLHEIPVFDIQTYSYPDIETELESEINETNIIKSEAAINKLLSNNDTWFVTQVFIQCQNQSILKLSRDTKINRSYLTSAYKKGKELLYKEVIAET